MCNLSWTPSLLEDNSKDHPEYNTQGGVLTVSEEEQEDYDYHRKLEEGNKYMLLAHNKRSFIISAVYIRHATGKLTRPDILHKKLEQLVNPQYHRFIFTW